MSRMLLLLLLALTGSVLIRPAVAQQSAPVAARSAMTKEGVSLYTKTLTLNGEPVLLHVWCIPQGYSEMAKQLIADEKRTLPVPREHILKADILMPSPFFVDVFTSEAGNWTRRQRASFSETGDVHAMEVRWLKPTAKIGPVFLLTFGQTHWMTREVITYPEGIRGKPAVQRFLWGGEGESYQEQSFDTRDKRGILQVRERSQDSDEKPEIVKTYRWDAKKRRYQ